jgi:anti-sigma-K factor RskA
METGVHGLTAAYALDALDPAERREYEEHLAGCEQCRDELASFWQTTEALAVGASGAQPSSDLRDRILAGARAERQVVVPFEPPRRRPLAPVLGAAAAVAAVIALAVGFWALQVSSDLDDARSALDRERAALSVIADPTARTVALQTGDGRLIVDDDGRAALVVHDLGPAPAGKTYELWIVDAGGVAAPAGLFPGRDGVDVVGLEGTVGSGEGVAVTVEEKGGAEEPTTMPIVASQPA